MTAANFLIGCDAEFRLSRFVWFRWTLQWLKEYFVIISAFALVVGVGWATVFLYGYLKVFDWRLLWVIQYQDILTFALIAVALIGGSASVCGSVIDALFYTGSLSGAPKWGLISGLVIAFMLVVGATLLSEHLSTSPHYLHIFYGAASLVDGVGLAIVLGSWFHFRAWPNLVQFAWGVAAALGGGFVLGSWLGYSVLESSANNVNVTLKTETVTDAKLILMLSHHTILYENQSVLVVPTDDVKKIESTH